MLWVSHIILSSESVAFCKCCLFMREPFYLKFLGLSKLFPSFHCCIPVNKRCYCLRLYSNLLPFSSVACLWVSLFTSSSLSSRSSFLLSTVATALHSASSGGELKQESSKKRGEEGGWEAKGKDSKALWLEFHNFVQNL